MKYRIERMQFITREYVRANRDKLFLFGDNLEQRGFGGQAAAMRGEPNALGIPTKKNPSYKAGAFFSDDEFEQNKTVIDAAFAEVIKAVTDSIHVIVVPSDGLGTGRAKLDKQAPRTFAYLQKRLAELASE
ncbi:MAG: hypothetical protein KF855_17160 [Acidobacteria bacterium]|nr:hypothetical protein [Acidobacteriota bacterium]